jgi:hypothetical protein
MRKLEATPRENVNDIVMMRAKKIALIIALAAGLASVVIWSSEMAIPNRLEWMPTYRE